MKTALNELQVEESIATTIAGTTTLNGAAVDMSSPNCQGVLFIAKISTGAADNTLHAQQASDSGFSSPQNLEGSQVATEDILMVDVKKPRKGLGDFVRPVLTRGTSTVVEWVLAIRYGLATQPAVNDVAGTSAAVSVVSPAVGTP